MEPESHISRAQQAVLRKMRIFAVVSIGIMFAGFLAVMSAIVYRTVKPKDAELSKIDTASPSAQLPAGAHIIAMTADEGRLFIALQMPDGTHVIRSMDAKTLSLK
jgi:hypothetical protein